MYLISFIVQALAKFEEINLGYCDLKPHNILVKYELKEGKGFLKLAISDFGAAFVRDDDSENRIKYGDVGTQYY